MAAASTTKPYVAFATILDAAGQFSHNLSSPENPAILTALASWQEMTKLAPPPGITMSRRKMKGPRVAARGRMYDGLNHSVARWPQDGLNEASIPIVICVTNGTADLRMGEYILHCEKGACVVVPPGVPFTDNSAPHLTAEDSKESCCDLLWLCAWSVSSGVECWMCHSQSTPVGTHVESPNCYLLDTRVTQYFHALIEEARDFQEGRQHPGIVSGLLCALPVAIQRALQESRCFEPSAHILKAPVKYDDNSAIGSAQAYMATHLSSTLTIEKVARSIYMSRTRFACRFRAETGKTFTQYLTELRVAEAKRLLIDTRWSVEVIGQMVGIKSPSHLRRLLTLHEGVAPLGFRRQHQDSSGKTVRNDSDGV